MSHIIGDGGDGLRNFVLNNGSPLRIFWYGDPNAFIGTPFIPSIATVYSRVVRDNGGMDFNFHTDVFTTDVHAEAGPSGASAAVFRIIAGGLV
jgi:hypothetical protein